MAGKLNLTLAREMLAFIARFFSMITTYPGTEVPRYPGTYGAAYGELGWVS